MEVGRKVGGWVELGRLTGMLVGEWVEIGR